MADLVEVEGDELSKSRERLERLAPALRQVGAYLESRSQAAFREQGRGPDRWPPRMVPNVPGIVRDLNRGGQPKRRRFTGRPALVDTGRLRNSIRSRLQGKTLIVGTTLDYGRTHQQGGESVVELTGHGRRGLRELLGKRKDLREDLGWLFAKPRLTVQVRQRKFVTVEDEDVPVIERIMQSYLSGGEA